MTEAVSAVSSVPGVTAGSAIRWLPLNHETITSLVAPSAMAGAPEDERPLATANYAYPGYFETMGIEVVAGRDFGTLDDTEAQSVVIVNRNLADRFWPDGSAIGQTLLMGNAGEAVEATVVGVVGEVHHADMDPANVGPQFYRPALQASSRRFFVLGRTEGDPANMVPGIRAALGAVAPDLPLTIRPMVDVVGENQMQWSLGSAFLALFGGGALLLAALGIYGLISYSVSQRNREIGVRIALGASKGEIRRSVVTDGLKLTGMGLAIGLALTFAAGRAIAAILYGVSPADPLTVVAVLALFGTIAALASFVPAARASGTDPITVLRAE